MSVDSLLKPLLVGRMTLPNRFVMAPLTRTRASDDHVPTDMMVKHYADRASFGLILAEATQIREGYSTFGFEPGIYSKEQVQAWRKVTDAVHEKGGYIYLQIHHGGRSTVPCNITDESIRICSSSEGGVIEHKCPAGFNRDWKEQPYPPKVHALTEKEIAYHVKLYAFAAKNAMAAGFDGVQIHGANSYLIDQFLRDSCNKRTDQYGGSIENRCRFLFEVVDAVIAAVGADRTALRISPLNSYNDMTDSDPEALTRYICTELNKRKIAFLDVIRGDFFSDRRGADEWARESYNGVLFTGLKFELDEAEEAVKSGRADGVVFGLKAIANPDLVARAIAGAELNAVQQETIYGRTDEGYNTYPTLKELRLAAMEKAEKEAEEKEAEGAVEAAENGEEEGEKAEEEAEKAEEEKEEEGVADADAADTADAAAAAADPRFPHLSAEEITKIKEAFVAIDVDGSGKLEEDEIAKFLESMGSNCTTEEIQSMIEVYGGGSNAITEEGFLNMFEDQSEGFREEAKEKYPNLADISPYVSMFRRFDKDFSYTIDNEELKEMMLALTGEEITDEEVEAVTKGAPITLPTFLLVLNVDSMKEVGYSEDEGVPV